MKKRNKNKQGIYTKIKEKIHKAINRVKYQFRPSTLRRRARACHPKRVWAKLRGVHPYHWILFGATLISLALMAFHYRVCVERTVQTILDLFDSLVIYAKVMLSPTAELPQGVVARIAQIPKVDISAILPFDLAELQRRLRDMWGCVFKFEYAKAYLNFIVQKSYYFLLYGQALVSVAACGWIIFRRFLFVEKKDHGKDTRPLAWWKRGPEKVLSTIWRRIKDFYAFFKESRYKKILGIIWVINFNVATIAIELLSFYFYFISVFSFKGFYVILVRLFLDALIALLTSPLMVWAVIGWIYFDKTRRKIGYRILRGHEGDNKSFLKRLPVVSMILGTMGTGKTTMLSDAGLTQQNTFREEAKDLLFQADLKFPDFPWQRFEDAIQGAIAHHKTGYAVRRAMEDQEIFNGMWHLLTPADWRYWSKKHNRGIWSLASCKRFVEGIRARYEADPCPHNLFGYDIGRQAVIHDDGLMITELFDILSEYARLYYLYVIESPLLVANYSVRSDASLQTVGNFPEWNSDYFERSVIESRAAAQYAHIVDFDTLRLGNLVDSENPRRGSFEFGVVLLSEVGKERGNAVENRGKKRMDEEANAVNDGFNSRLKMSRHAAVIANHSFVKIFTDEQRAESWGADARDLCKLVTIEKRSGPRLAMPFYSFEGLLYELIYPRFKDFYYELRFVRGDNTLTGYLLKKLFAPIYRYHTKVINTFGYAVLSIDLKDGTTDGEGEGEKDQYYLMNKKIYADRFCTDCYSDLFEAASMEASVGLDDYPTYGATRATWDEMEQEQHSYFVRELTRQFSRKAKEK